MSKKVKLLDLDSLESPSMEIKAGGRTYKLNDPTTSQMYLIKGIADTYGEANEQLMADPSNEVNKTIYSKAVLKLAQTVLEMFNDDVDLSTLEEKQVEAIAIAVTEFAGEAFMKGRGNGI